MNRNKQRFFIKTDHFRVSSSFVFLLHPAFEIRKMPNESAENKGFCYNFCLAFDLPISMIG